MLLWRKTIEIQIFSFAGFASIRQGPTVLTSPGRRVANAFEGFAIDTRDCALPRLVDAGSSGDSTISIFKFLVLCVVEIKSASIDCSRDQDKMENGIPVVSVSNRGKRIVNYGTSTRIYTVDYEIKGDRGKMFGKTIEVENVP